MPKAWRPLLLTTLLMGLFAIGSMLTLLGFYLYDSYQEEHRRAQVITQNLSRVLEEHAKSTFHKLDIVLQNSRNHLYDEKNPKRSSQIPQQMRGILKAQWQNIQETDAIRIADSKGNVIFSTEEHVPKINIADRFHFRAARDNPQSGLIFSEPIISRATGHPILILARRLETSDGRFAGIVYAPIQIEYFTNFYQSLNLGPHGVVAMRSVDNHREIARYPQGRINEPIAPQKSPVQPFLDRNEDSGTFDVVSPVDSSPRTSSFRRISDTPFYIIVGLGKQDYLASWKTKAIYLSIGVMLFGLLMVMLLRQIWRGQKREDEIIETLRRAQTVAQMGSWGFDLQKNQLFWTDEVFNIFGVSGDTPLSYEAFLDHVHPDDRSRVDAAWQKALKGADYDIEHRIVVNGAIKWVHEKAMVSLDERGRPITGIGTVRDVTSGKQWDEQNRLAASVFSNSHDGVIITDPDGQIIEVNQAFTELTGYAREDVLGRNPRLLKSDRHNPEFYLSMWKSIIDTGHWRGEIWNRKKNGEAYIELLSISAVMDERRNLTHYVGVFTDITSLKESQQRLEQLAHFDALTHLPNRTLLADRMQQAIAHAQRQECLLAVCFIDLDDFKPINDKHGHETGDRLLIEVGARLKGTVREGDTVARLGGDEFILLLTDIKAMDELEETLSRILPSLSAPYRLNNLSLQLSASIGVTVFPFDGADPDALLRHADQAMYLAKQSGRNRYHMFDAEQDRMVRSRREHLERLREALNDGEFRLHYQPKANLRTGEIVGAEALIRWQHPERGLLPPAEFLPLAEETELITEIGEWVLHEALRQMSSWMSDGLVLPVSVNIAIRHLQRADFVPRLMAIRAAHPDIPAGQLELEILETTALANMSHAQEVIGACRELGVSISLDDFGTGYSSLSYLKRLPANTLKIDRSFVRDMLEDPEDLAIIEGVIGLTNAFQRTVIAEGVETVEQGVMLMQLGCDLAQGYGIARPMPGDAMQEWIRNFRPAKEWIETAPLNWGREDYPLLAVGVEHKRWVAQILNALNEKRSPTPLELHDHHHCRFGSWYYGYGKKYYGELPEFAMIEPLHIQVHELGLEVIRLRDAGKPEQAQALAQELCQLRDQVLEQLLKLQVAVALAYERIT